MHSQQPSPPPLSRGLERLWFHFHLGCSGASFSKVPIINGPLIISVYIKDRGFYSFACNVIKLSVNETKWSCLLARTRVLILYISI